MASVLHNTRETSEQREEPMAPQCWFCGTTIRRGEPAERLPHGEIAVHAKCVQKDGAGDDARRSGSALTKAA